ncbi:MAG: gamma-glutamylcyclotransferase [Anaerolineae bacterium]|nr:gamma-glutamylcyclotransferase [Anaerolineae bacterium]
MRADAPQLPFFVYGTLLPGEANFYLWREAIVRFRPAILNNARMFSLGRFPMAIDAPEGEVRGLVVDIRPSSYLAALSLLDQLEGVRLHPVHGSGYTRVRRLVRPAGEPAVVAWVYLGDAFFVRGRRPIDVAWKTYTCKGP